MADELIDLDLEVVHSTQDAILLSDGDTEDWVPWSLIAADDLLRWFDYEKGDTYTFSIFQWKAKDIGFI